jgi:glycosyltransferase 2 family protein
MRRKFLLGTALAASLLGLFLYNTDFGQMRAALAQAKLWPILLACALQASTFTFRAWRWRLLLGERGKHVPFWSLFHIAAIGFMLNNFVPRGTGELARSYLLGRNYRTGISTTFATIVLERLFDFLTVLVLLATLLAGFDLPFAQEGPLSAERFRFVGWLVSAGTLGLAVMLGLLFARASFVLGVFRRILRPLSEALADKVLGLLETFIEGLHCLTSFRALVGVVFHSVLLWATLFATFLLVQYAFNFQLPITAPMLILVLSVFSMFVPSPGGVGAMHFAVMQGLKLFGVAAGPAQAMAIVLHASGYVPVSLTGLVSLRLEGLGLRQLGSAEEAAEQAVHPASPPEAVAENLS